jgi:hypothetical protein
MHTRAGFARFRPLLAIDGLAGCTVALFTCDWMEPKPPAPRLVALSHCVATVPCDVGCSDVRAPVPSHGIRNARRRLWELGDIPRRNRQDTPLAGANRFE